MSLNQSFISDFSEYYRWSQRTKIKYKYTDILTFHIDSFSFNYITVTFSSDGLLCTLFKLLLDKSIYNFKEFWCTF